MTKTEIIFMASLFWRAATFTSFAMVALCLSVGSAMADDVKSYVAFECSFPREVGANVKKGKWVERGWDKDDSYSVVFASVDAAKGTAQQIGDLGASNLIVLKGDNSLNILEPTPSGNLVLTTIFSGEKDATFLAVTSRHMNVFGEAIVSQMFGSCRGKN